MWNPAPTCTDLVISSKVRISRSNLELWGNRLAKVGSWMNPKVEQAALNSRALSALANNHWCTLSNGFDDVMRTAALDATVPRVTGAATASHSSSDECTEIVSLVAQLSMSELSKSKSERECTSLRNPPTCSPENSLFQILQSLLGLHPSDPTFLSVGVTQLLSTSQKIPNNYWFSY